MKMKKWAMGSILLLLTHVIIRYIYLTQSFNTSSSDAIAGLMGMAIGYSFTALVSCIAILIIGKLVKPQNRITIFSVLSIGYLIFKLIGNSAMGSDAYGTTLEEVLYCATNIIFAFWIFSGPKKIVQKPDSTGKPFNGDPDVTSVQNPLPAEVADTLEENQTPSLDALSIMQEAQVQDSTTDDSDPLCDQTSEMGLPANDTLFKELQNSIAKLKARCTVLIIIALALAGALLYVSTENKTQADLLEGYRSYEKYSMDVLDFYVENARFVYPDDEYYHTYACPKVAPGSSYWIFNKEYCEFLGNKECSVCGRYTALSVVSKTIPSLSE